MSWAPVTAAFTCIAVAQAGLSLQFPMADDEKAEEEEEEKKFGAQRTISSQKWVSFLMFQCRKSWSLGLQRLDELPFSHVFCAFRL